MRKFLLILLPLVLSACGFKPLHSTEYRAQQAIDLSSLVITVDNTRRGQLLEAELRDAVNPDYTRQEKLYKLSIKLKELDIPLFINPDGTSSRGDIQLESTYVLTRILDSRQVADGKIARISSYNTSDQASQGYASYISVEDAKKRGVIELAEDYKLRMANLLAKLNTEATQ
jgi:hypothetical protein